MDVVATCLVIKGGTAKESKAHDLAGNRQDWTPHWVDSKEKKPKRNYTNPLLDYLYNCYFYWLWWFLILMIGFSAMFGCLKPSLGPNVHLFNLTPASVDPYGQSKSCCSATNRLRPPLVFRFLSGLQQFWQFLTLDSNHLPIVHKSPQIDVPKNWESCTARCWREIKGMSLKNVVRTSVLAILRGKLMMNHGIWEEPCLRQTQVVLEHWKRKAEKQPVASRDYLVELEGQACHHFQTQTANYGRKTRTKIFKYLQICQAAKIACSMETPQVSIFKALEILRIS